MWGGDAYDPFPAHGLLELRLRNFLMLEQCIPLEGIGKMI